MRSRLFAIILTVPLAGCALLNDLQYGPDRLKPHDHGAVQTYPSAVAEAPSPATETARPSHRRAAPLPRHRHRTTNAPTPGPEVAAPPADGVSAPLPAAPVEDAAPVATPAKEHVADAPKKPVKLKKCRAPGGWQVWRRKCPPPPTDG